MGDDNHFVMEGIVDIGQSLVGPSRRLIDFGRAFHVQGFVRALVVEDFEEVIEPGLLLKEIQTSRLGGFFLQREMHAFMTAVLLRMARLNPFNADAQPEPPDREFA